MRDHPHLLRADGQRENVAALQLGGKLSRGPELGLDAENDDIRLHILRLKRKAVGAADRFGNDLCIRMIDPQPLAIVLKRIERASRDYTRLSHRAAEQLAMAASFLDQLLRPGERRA